MEKLFVKETDTIIPERRNMKLNQTIPKEQLIKDYVYRLYYKGVKKELAVFCHLGGEEKMPIFHPLGEPDFQSIFGLENYEGSWIVIGERESTAEDRGYE